MYFLNVIVSFFQSMVLNKKYTPAYVAELNKRDAAKKSKKKKKPSMYQRMMEQQQAAQNGGTAPVKKIPTSYTDENGEEIKLSKSAQKDMQSKIIADARRRMAEKYGEEYDDSEN